MRSDSYEWTHPSVLEVAGDGDPVETVLQQVRTLLLQAIDAGWEGPPFDPVGLADFLNLKVVARDDVRDARLVPGERDAAVIEFNPNRSTARRRFSLAHEIAHTLFPGYPERVWYRRREDEAVREDEWQVEVLCNLAAAEILMPIEGLDKISEHHLAIDNVLRLREVYEVSTEAILIRLARVADFPCAIFAASRSPASTHANEYRVDYWIASRLWELRLGRHPIVPTDSVVTDCTAIGYTSKGDETWKGVQLHVECVAIPPYPKDRYPRVVGTLKRTVPESPHSPCLRKVLGDAREPRGDGPHMIAHVVNDATENWGGNGFAVALKRRWDATQADFRQWVEEDRDRLNLGNVRFYKVGDDLFVASMIAQEGYGPSSTPRIRYAHLRDCLTEVANYAREIEASVHLPRIGCGHGGGNWRIVEDILRETLCRINLNVTVYDLPDQPFDEGKATHRQLALEGLA